MENDRIREIITVLQVLFPKTKTFLNYTKDYELLFAVILSAQTTDVSVNHVTEVLFRRFPTLEDYTQDRKEEIEEILKPLGLFKSKAEYLILTAEKLRKEYGGNLPKDRNELMKLPGVGYKTSGVVLAELYDEPYFPVDTHVKRVSVRLGIVSEKATVKQCEETLEKRFEGCHMIHLHRQFILFGRNVCTARNPDCPACPFADFCRFHKKRK